MRSRPRIAITVGDPNGIGPEIIIKVLSQDKILSICQPIIIAPAKVVAHYLKVLGLELQVEEETDLDRIQGHPDGIALFDPGFAKDYRVQPGTIDKVGGRIAGSALEVAASLARDRVVDAVVTAPVSKKAFNMAGYPYPGQTEFFAARFHTDAIVMILLSGEFRVALATTHCALASVSELLSTEVVLTKLTTLAKDLRERFEIAEPQIAMAALNPHAGESGILGREEIEILIPAVQAARSHGIDVAGPFPADTLFARQQEHHFDAYLAMYHDQGLIPIKMKSFGRCVNYTAGLPIIRTSPDHGTAFDIAGRGVANPNSFEEAMKLAARLASQT